MHLNRLRLIGDVGREDGLRAFAVERGPTCQHLVRHASHGVDVRAMIDIGIPRRLLWRHVGRRPHRHARRGQIAPLIRRRGHGFCHTEIRHERVFCGQQHVVRLDVAMDDPVLVRKRECVNHVPDQTNGISDRQLTRARQPGPQRLALDERHHEIQEPFGFARIVQRQDVGMGQFRCNGDLAEKPLRAQRRRQFRAQDLYGDLPVVLHVLREEYGRHAAGTDFALDVVQSGQGRFQAVEMFVH